MIYYNVSSFKKSVSDLFVVRGCFVNLDRTNWIDEQRHTLYFQNGEKKSAWVRLITQLSKCTSHAPIHNEMFSHRKNIWKSVRGIVSALVFGLWFRVVSSLQSSPQNRQTANHKTINQNHKESIWEFLNSFNSLHYWIVPPLINWNGYYYCLQV